MSTTPQPSRLEKLHDRLSQSKYCRAAMFLGSIDGNLTGLLSAHLSIGVPQAVKLFGTEAQKK